MKSSLNKIIEKIDFWQNRIIQLISVIGLSQAYIYLLKDYRNRRAQIQENFYLLSKSSKFPVLCRPHTSDIKVFSQIFIEREYSCLDEISNVNYIIDCGANVGYSSAYLLTRFPDAKIVCIEPDPSNFAMLEQNMAPYKSRVKLIRAGLWSHPTGLKFSEQRYRDGGEWGVQVRECSAVENPDLQAIDLGSVLQELDVPKISILKMDIEGAEAVVFSKNYESWLPCFDNIVIELHDDTYFGKASEIVLDSIKSYGNKDFQISTCGELMVFKS
jgi:FkbM family methyltransferase